jgi:hypothetical protein
MDAVKQLTWDAARVVGVLGNVSTCEFVIAELGRDGIPPLTDAEMTLIRLKGFTFLGVVGRFEDGRIDAAAEPGVNSASVMAHAVVAFIGLMGSEPAPDAESAEWLERLYQRPDTRGN